MARPAKVVGLRTSGLGEATEPEAPVLPTKKQGMYQFRAAKASFRLSLTRRRVGRDVKTGERYEEAQRSTDGFDVPLDQVLFEDNYFETPSKDLAELIRNTKGYGVGREVWAIEDQKAAQDMAMENELRARIAARPDIAARVLKPSDSEDFVLPAAPA